MAVVDFDDAGTLSAFVYFLCMMALNLLVCCAAGVDTWKRVRQYHEWVARRDKADAAPNAVKDQLNADEQKRLDDVHIDMFVWNSASNDPAADGAGSRLSSAAQGAGQRHGSFAGDALSLAVLNARAKDARNMDLLSAYMDMYGMKADADVLLGNAAGNASGVRDMGTMLKCCAWFLQGAFRRFSLFAPILVHSWDTATDVGVLLNWINNKDYIFASMSITAMLLYRCVGLVYILLIHTSFFSLGIFTVLF